MKERNPYPPSPNPPTTQGHPMPCTFLSDREHDTEAPCTPPTPACPRTPLQFHPSYLPPGLHRVPTKAATPKKRKGKKRREKNTAATMQNSAGPRTVFCPGPCLSSPGLSVKHTLFSGGTTAWRLGGWNRGVAILPLWPKEERAVPAWSRSHPLPREHLSLLVMDVRRPCSCMDTNGGELRHTERRISQLITDHSEALESIQQGVHSPRLRRQGTEPCLKAPGWGPMLNGLREHTRRN
ncbi:unnamed protein product [Pleuronectes platessa]|uniref:Uncharacterized protein n=1 Tax=Pleuronectes platessa TaxID=8262 RepID=A0A9N7UQK7_PLEPL|nr:unnamed protein product [Pleuronectes platessa]